MVRKTVHLVLGTFFTFFAFSATAQVPTEVSTFGSWSVNNGQVTYSCPAGWVCSVVTQDNGFLQVSMTQPGAQTSYLRTVVTDPAASFNPQNDPTPFYDETVVQMGSSGVSATTGIIGQQVIEEGVFTSSVNIGSGWGMVVTNGKMVEINQSIVDPGSAGVGDDFVYNIQMFEGQSSGTLLDINQAIGLAGAGSGTDVQAFTLRERSGGQVPTSGTLQLPDGTSVSYDPADTIRTTWIGQSVDLSTGGMMSFAGGDFGFQMVSIEGASTNTAVENFTLFATDPFVWDPVYGPNPCLLGTDGSIAPSGMNGNVDVCP